MSDSTQGDATLKVLPLQYFELPDGVMLKRGRHQIRISGAQSVAAVQTVLAAAADGASTAADITERFAAPERPQVASLLQELQLRRFVVPSGSPEAVHATPESSNDVFYWHFGIRTGSVAETHAGRIAIIGVNCISRQLAVALGAAGFDKVDVVHYPLLCNFRLTTPDGRVSADQWPQALPQPLDYDAWRARVASEALGCLVATSDFGGLKLMSPWNEFCVRGAHPFLPVVLQDMIGYVGPIVVPGETACFECLRARQNANMSDPALTRLPEERAFVEQVSTGFHPSMASILGDLAALELTRFHARLGPPRLVGALLEVSLLAPSITVRKVLKLPRCPVCSSVRLRSPASPHRNVFLPGNEWHE